MRSAEAAREPLGAARGVALAAGTVAIAAALVQLGLTVDGLAGGMFLATLAVVSAIDVEERRVPNAIVLPAALVALAWVAAFHGSELRDCLLAGLGAGLFFATASVVTRGGVGMGDAKLALLLGLVLGRGVVAAILFATTAGAVAAVIALASRDGDARRRAIPYAPFLAGGAALAVLLATASPLHG